MIPQTKKYFILIVHHGVEDPTNKLVETLLTGSHRPQKIIVVDHADQPFYGSISHPHLQIIRPTMNAGYAAGLNIGLGMLLNEGVAATDIVVGMNNDVEVTSDTLAQLADWWEQHPGPALVGTKAGSVNLFTGRARLASNFQFSIFNFHLLPYIHGAFLCAPYQVFMHLTGLPTDYFLYWEDVLFSTRAGRQGIRLRLAQGVTVSHDERQNKISDERLYYLVRNGALFLGQETSWPWRVWWGLINKGRRLYHRGLIGQALADAAAGKSGKMPSYDD